MDHPVYCNTDRTSRPQAGAREPRAGGTPYMRAVLGSPCLSLKKFLPAKAGVISIRRLDGQGNQMEDPVEWAVNDFLTEMPERTTLRGLSPMSKFIFALPSMTQGKQSPIMVRQGKGRACHFKPQSQTQASAAKR